MLDSKDILTTSHLEQAPPDNGDDAPEKNIQALSPRIPIPSDDPNGTNNQLPEAMFPYMPDREVYIIPQIP